jgi:hypothetical protein
MSQQLVHGHTDKRSVDSEFKHLQSIMSCGSCSTSTLARTVQTKTDARFEATKHLLLTALQLLSAAKVLEEYTEVICSNESSCTLITKKSKQLKKYIVPMISYTGSSLDEIGNSLSPISSVNYVHCRMEVKPKSDSVDDRSNSLISPDFQLVVTTGAEKAWFKYYQEKILSPGINLKTEEVLQFQCDSRNLHPQQGNCCCMV